LIEPGEQIKERRFSRTVRPNQSCDRVSWNFNVLDIDGDKATKLATNAIGNENRVLFRNAGFYRTDVETRRFDG
jgi:hypothetical protein